jgi:hypothetical protein
MRPPSHRAVRRLLLETLYAAYLDDPLHMVEPEPFLDLPGVDRKTIIPNMHYLHDRSLVEMMMGYSPPMFSAVRITADGIDLVEDRYRFNLQFPPQPGNTEEAMSAIPALIDQLIAEGDLSALEGWVRRQLLNDIQYLRDELMQPQAQWRPEVLRAILDWIGQRHCASEGALSALVEIQVALAPILRQD